MIRGRNALIPPALAILLSETFPRLLQIWNSCKSTIQVCSGSKLIGFTTGLTETLLRRSS
jgi:hypothetical protein